MTSIIVNQNYGHNLIKYVEDVKQNPLFCAYKVGKCYDIVGKMICGAHALGAIQFIDDLNF